MPTLFILLSALTVGTTVSKDTLQTADSAYVITTICAPICSSVARVYAINKEQSSWQLVRTMCTPDSTMVFPEAFFENGQIRWKDNSKQLLDEEGR